MAAEEDSEECTSKLLSTITQTTSSGGATLPSVGIGGGERKNGGLKALPMTTSRGAAAPHRLPAASGRDRHVRDSPVILGCARSLAGIVSPVSLASCEQRLLRAPCA
jgi:hypothetical protein